jgi:branched-chain amino acid transport system substrate-binding protein
MVCAKVVADMMAKGFRSVALLTGTDGVGKSMRKECTDAATARTISIVAAESFNPKDVDMTPQLTKIKNTQGVEAIFVGGFGQPLSIVTRNYGQLGINIPQYHAHGSASKAYIELAGTASEGVRLPGPLLLVAKQLSANDPLKPAAIEYADTYKRLTGKDVSTFGGYSYDALLLIADAIKRAGSAEAKAIRTALEETKNLAGVTGMFNMTAKDHMGIDETSLYMVEVRGGDWVLAQ